MKKIHLLGLFLILTFHTGYSQSNIFELSPSQSMCITGKGPGQDAALNPFLKMDSYGIIENIGKNDFTIRVQNKGNVIEQITIKPKGIKKVVLLKGYELYLDSELQGKAKVNFKPYLN